ncbi:androgen-induced gene 1 protein-like isoform X5 [Chelonoidis abingdonii]|uniref:androgen-induced gene 1 protein-like isoform X5 n=1 Tax=Chelonoidis abingdonii TaxID=106734 RepID=UPI0013F182B7|nr:androgen-induced gene 1 protein-like isoform X4 [Chelonoidis abingdonii]
MAARLLTLIHLCCFLWASFSLSQNVGMPHSLRRESENTYGGRWKYLTFINQILQTLLFGICVIIDFAHMFIPATKKSVSSRLLPPRDFIFSVLVFPVGLFVAVTFWTLYAYDRELVYPKELDEINPPWLNHTMPQHLQQSDPSRTVSSCTADRLANLIGRKRKTRDEIFAEFMAKSHGKENQAG